jgi:hypothetical protein
LVTKTVAQINTRAPVITYFEIKCVSGSCSYQQAGILERSLFVGKLNAVIVIVSAASKQPHGYK